MNKDLISREEAMDVIKSLQITLGGKNIFRPEAKASVLECLDFVPKVDAVEVVRCRDCRYWRQEVSGHEHWICTQHSNEKRTFYTLPTFFCADGMICRNRYAKGAQDV